MKNIIIIHISQTFNHSIHRHIKTACFMEHEIERVEQKQYIMEFKKYGNLHNVQIDMD